MCHWGDMRDSAERANPDRMGHEGALALEMTVDGRYQQCLGRSPKRRP
jgi:hypothetical protein